MACWKNIGEFGSLFGGIELNVEGFGFEESWCEGVMEQFWVETWESIGVGLFHGFMEDELGIGLSLLLITIGVIKFPDWLSCDDIENREVEVADEEVGKLRQGVSLDCWLRWGILSIPLEARGITELHEDKIAEFEEIGIGDAAIDNGLRLGRFWLEALWIGRYDDEMIG